MSQVNLSVKLDYEQAVQKYNELVKQLGGKTIDIKINPVSGKITQQTMKDVGKEVKNTAKEVNNLDNANKKATVSQKKMNQEVKQADGFFTKLGKSIAHDLGEMLKWSIAATAIYGSLRKIGEAIEYVTAMDTALTNIRMASGLTREETQGLAQDYLNLGKELGIAVEEIANSATELYRQGLNTAEVNDRLADYIKLSKVLGRDLQSTIEMGTAGTTAFGVSIQKLGDIASAVGDATASSGDEIMIAIQKAGMSAQTAGVSLEELASMSATISATTRESGSIVGTSMKSILSKLSQVDDLTGEINDDYGKTLSRLTDLGIAIEDQSGNLLGATDILKNVGKEWDNLSNQEQKYLASGFGVYQVNRFQALVKGMTVASGEYTDNLAVAYNSFGTTADKYEEYSKSIEASTARMGNEWKELYQNTLNSGLIISIVDLIGKFADFIDKTNLLTIATIALSTAMVILAVKNIPLLILNMMSAISTTAFLGKSLWTLIPGVEALTVALGGLGAVMFGLVAVTAIVVTGLYAIKKAEEEAYQSVLDTADALVKQNEETKNLMSSLDDLKDKTSLSKEEQVKLEGVYNRLVSVYPELANKIDLATISHKKLSDAMIEVQRNALKVEHAILNVAIAEESAKLSKAEADAQKYGAMGSNGGEQTTAYRDLKIGTSQTEANLARKRLEELKKKKQDLMMNTGIYGSSEPNKFGFDEQEKRPSDGGLIRPEKDDDSGSSAHIDPLDALQKYRDAIDAVTLSLSALEAEKASASDEEMVEILERENEQYKLRQIAMHEYKLSLDVQAKTLKKDSKTYSEDLQKIRDEQKKLGLEWWDDEKAIQANIKAIGDLGEKIREVKRKEADDLSGKISDALDKIKGQMEDDFDSEMEAYDIRIQMYEDELDALERKNKELEDEAERLKIITELEKARLKLANIKEQKNVRMYTGVGESGFEFVADPIAIKEQTEVIKDLEEQLYEFDVESAREAELQKLKDKIDGEKRLKEAEQKSYNERKDKFEKFQDDLNDITKNQGKINFEMISGFLTSLGISESDSYQVRLGELQKFVSSYLSIISSLGVAVPSTVPTTGNKTVQVGKSGNAEKGLDIGTLVKTGGGTYQIVPEGTKGASYNKASGYYSVKVDNASNSGSRAIGGNVVAGKTYRVNELGMESQLSTVNGKDYLTPLTNGKILTAPETKKVLTPEASKGDINIGNISLPSVKNAIDFTKELQRIRIVNGGI